MFRKIIFSSLFFSCFVQFCSEITAWIEIKPSYFCFVTCPMKNIYDKGGFQVQASTTVPVHEYIGLYGSFGYRSVKGHAMSTCEKTTLSVVPIDLGVRPIVSFLDRYYFFATIGPRFFCFNQTNDSSYVDACINQSGIGFFINTGFNVEPVTHFLLGIFAEYSYETKTVCPSQINVYGNQNTQLGGVAVGVSLGYAF